MRDTISDLNPFITDMMMISAPTARVTAMKLIQAIRAMPPFLRRAFRYRKASARSHAPKGAPVGSCPGIVASLIRR